MNRKTKKNPSLANIPLRRCAACMKQRPKAAMARIAYYEGVLSVDRTGRAKGRGLYLCNTPDCRALAKKKKALQRGFSTGFDAETVDGILRDLEIMEKERENDSER